MSQPPTGTEDHITIPEAGSQSAQPTDSADADATGEQLYRPEPGERQLTVRAIVVGCLLGGLVAAMNIYFGLRTGWGFGGSLIAAILGYAFFAALRPKLPFGVLETNITQTTGSGAGSMTAAAGLLAPIPAMGMLGYDLSYLELSVWGISVAYLGVFYAVPLRQQMVVDEKLRFPTGTATAETILAMASSGADTVAKARTLLWFSVGAGVFTLAAFFLPSIGMPPLVKAIGLSTVAAMGFKLLLSPMMTGAGILIGPRVGASLLAGAVVGWAVLGPLAESQRWVTGPFMSYQEGARGWILWPGVAIMVADALTSLLLSWRTIVRTFRIRKPESDGQNGSDDRAIPALWWLGGLLLATVATVLVSWLVFDIAPYLTLVAVVLSWVLAMIATRSTGETDINPIGGMGKVTQLVYGALAPGAMATNLMAAGISGAGAMQAGDMMQDLKTGYLLGANPRKQFVAQLIGVAAGVLFCVPIYVLFDAAYEIGGEELPAPAAHAWKAMAELLSRGLDALPDMAGWAVLGGLVFGAIVPILRKTTRLAPYLPSTLAFGIAFIVPAYYSIAMFFGSMVLVAWQKADRASATALAFSVASGLVAGEGLMGIVTAVLTLLGLGPIVE